MIAIEEIEQKLLALPLKHRAFLAESLLASLPPAGPDLAEEQEMAEVERRESQIKSGQVRPLTDAEFWRQVESDVA
jgi:Putative addiction module component